MAEIRETRVEQDGRVGEVVIERPRKKGGFGWGLMLGVVLIAGAIFAFAYTQGSFQQAGVEADQAATQVAQSTESAVDDTSAAINDATGSNDAAGESSTQSAERTSETATN